MWFIGRGKELLERLRERQAEIEDAILARVRSVEDPGEVGDAAYVEGLRGAVDHAVALAISVLEGEEPHAEQTPQELTAQARLAARSGVSLGTVLRRYFAGHTLLCDYLVQEAGGGHGLQLALRSQAALLDKIVAAVSDAYKQEVEHPRRTVEQRRAEQVRKLLEGNPVDSLGLGYELEGWHLGVVAQGPSAQQALRGLATALDRRLLMVRPGGDAVWAWLGGDRRVEARDLLERARADLEPDALVAIGEPGAGIAGWRLTHRQARAALPIALRAHARVVGYSDVAILASALGDEVLTESLIDIYLAPLAQERDGGAALGVTLRAYFAAGRNVASAAAALGVSRQTVARRLKAAEEKIGRPLEKCGIEVETALRLRDLGSTTARPLPERFAFNTTSIHVSHRSGKRC